VAEISGVSGVVGIDPSLTGTGICRFDCISGLLWTELIATKPKDGTVIERAIRIALAVRGHLKSGDVVFMEDYAFGVKPSASSITQLAELNGVLKAAILGKTGYEPLLITTSEMRKFLCGDGRLKREMIPVEVMKLLGSAPASHDECVARVILEIGMDVLNPRLGVQYRRAITANVRRRYETFLQSLA